MNDIVFELKTRLINNQERQEELQKIVKDLPKGHINTLYRNNKGYYYLTYRQGKSVKNDYLGPEEKTNLNITIELLHKRKIYNNELKELKKEEKTLKKIIGRAK